MKLFKLIMIASMIMVSGVSQANPRGHGHHHAHGHARGADWIVPLVIGGAVVHVLTQPRPVIVQQPQVQYPVAPFGYHYEQILDANCNCYRLVLVQN